MKRRDPQTIGAFFNKKKKKNPWYAKITYQGKTYYLGSYSSQERANKAYLRAKARLKSPPKNNPTQIVTQGELF